MTKSVLHVIKTKSFKSDGRLLKWINSLKDHSITSEVFILEDENKSTSFKDNDASINTFSLRSRSLFSKGKGYFFKVPEFTYKCLKTTFNSETDTIIFHDVQHYLTLIVFVLFKSVHKKKIVWDLHELPHTTLSRNLVTKKIIKYILENVSLTVYTNNSRKDYVYDKFNLQNSRFIILNNYPDTKFILSKSSNIPEELNEWLNDKPYILWMGIASKGRNFMTLYQTFLREKNNLRLVIIGSIDKEIKNIIGPDIENNFIYQKFVNQDQIINYVDNALFSIVFYKANNPNNKYCEPNRLYQLLSRNVPVICGFNPPMKKTVEDLKGGIVLEDDGSDVNIFKPSFENMFLNHNMYKENLLKQNMTNYFSWESQFKKIAQLLAQ